MNYKSEVFGKGGIIARVVAKSKSSVTGKVITTFEIDFPRMILSELNTHRMLSKNSASSRAIPIKKTIEQVRTTPAMPVHWGKNQAGMKAKEELSTEDSFWAKSEWEDAALSASNSSERMESLGLHKQVGNRILEPFVFMKTVITGTEWNNFFYLRDHEDADPTIAELAKCMREANEQSDIVELRPGDWHTPYYLDGFWKDSGYAGRDMMAVDNKRDGGSTLANALAISSSCCAQVSFRLLDPSLEKADKIYERLVESKPVHASPFEHSATPMEDLYFENKGVDSVNVPFDPDSWQEGITHVDKNGKLWSGNFEGWIQHRQLIPNNVVLG